MNSANRKRTLLVSVAVILLCMTIILGVTFALFTDKETIENHLVAGDLSITLNRVSLVKTTLDEKGYLKELPADTTVVPFDQATNENVFGLTANEKIVPGSKFVAKMAIANNGDVACGYWIEVVCTDKSKGEDLAKQLKVTVDSVDGKIEDGLQLKGANGYIGSVEITKSKEFTITVEFLDCFDTNSGLTKYDNDKAKGEELYFDLIVHAEQLTEPLQ